LNFVGNCEGRDLLGNSSDVVVTDGFTGNVALKSMEGTLKLVFGELFKIFGTNEETKAATDVLLPYLVPIAEQLDPDIAGGAILLGIEGVCIISHGSSSATAVMNAVNLAHEMAVGGVTASLREAIS